MCVIFHLVHQVRYQLYGGYPRSTGIHQVESELAEDVSGHLEMFRGHRIIVVDVVEVVGILQIALDDVTRFSIGCDRIKVEFRHLLVR